jgi:para-nitrobenzyl esterase
MPGVRLAEIHSRSERRVYNYLFTWRSPAMRGALGSCHALELGFVFGTNHLAGMRRFAGEGPAAEKLASEMQDAWLAFARSGDPGCESLGVWPGYTEGRRATMLLGETSSVADAPFEEERRAWDGVPSGILGAL